MNQVSRKLRGVPVASLEVEGTVPGISWVAPWMLTHRLTHHPGLTRTEGCPGCRTSVNAKIGKIPGDLGDPIGHPVNGPDLFARVFVSCPAVLQSERAEGVG